MRDIAAGLMLLLLCGALPGRAAERMVVEPFPWWLAADAALARGDCGAALALLVPNAFEGHFGAIGRLGDIAETEACPGHDLPRPVALYEALVAAGAAIAKARLGQLHLRGEGVARDEALARRLFQEAVVESARLVWPPARRGNFAEVMGRHGIAPGLAAELDRIGAFEAKGGPGLHELSHRLRTGAGLPRNEEMALYFLRLAAYQSLPAAMYEYGLWELGNLGDPEDQRRALSRIVRAAEDGYRPAIRYVALRLVDGRNLRRWDFRTYVWLLRAREVGWDVADEIEEVAARLTELERSVAEEWLREGRLPLVTYVAEQ